MDTIQKRKLKMKPKWYFFLGSMLGFIGLLASVIVTAFFISLISFTLRPHPGPGYPYRLQLIWNSFPWWAVILAIFGLGTSIFLLKKYDFSYRKNFWLIIVGLTISIILSGILMDKLGLTDLWTKKGPMRGMYHQNSYYSPQRNSLN